MINTEALWTPADLAQYLGRSEKTLANDRYAGRGPIYLKIASGAVRYRRSDVEAWLKTQECAPTEPALVQPLTTRTATAGREPATRPGARTPAGS